METQSQLQPSPRQKYWVRLKPYSPKRGYRLKRVHYLGRLWLGGNGIDVDEIPEWVKVGRAAAAELKKLRQDGYTYNTGARRAFDICTEDQRAEIDAKEEDYRKAALGLRGATITELPDVTARRADMTSKASQPKRLTLEDLEDAPAPTESVEPVLTSADEDDDQLGTVAAAAAAGAPQVKADETDLTGRAAATEGFEEPGTHDLNDTQDVNEVAPQHGKTPGEAPEATPQVPAPRSGRGRSQSR